MVATIQSLESDALTALRSFLLAALPTGVEIVAGQYNRVPEPAADDYVVMIPFMRTRLSTNTTAFINAGTIVANTFPIQYSPGQSISTQATDFVVQCDVHGPNSGDNCQLITTLFRDRFATISMATAPVTVSPLYASDPRQIDYIDSEDQFENRWRVDLHMQVNPSVTTPLQSASHLGPVNYHKVSPG